VNNCDNRRHAIVRGLRNLQNASHAATGRCNQHEQFQEEIMSVAKVSEITATSSKSFEDAINAGLKRASETIDHIEGAWVKEMKVRVKDGKVKEYRVNMKLTFVLR
jgi:flavin-binding protein dodecin